jgi:hypothetical protein
MVYHAKGRNEAGLLLLLLLLLLHGYERVSHGLFGA